jgi:hypothetical protein
VWGVSVTLDQLRRMLSGACSQAQGPDLTSPRPGGKGSLVESRTEAPIRETPREDHCSHKPSPSTDQTWESTASCPSRAAGHSQERTQTSLGPSSTGSKAASSSLERLSRWREARLPFSRFLDEVTVRVLDPGTLESFRGTRSRCPELSPGEQGLTPTQESLAGATAPEEKELAQNPQCPSEATTEATGGMGPGRASDARALYMGSDRQGGQAAFPNMCRVSLSPSLSPSTKSCPHNAG